MANKVHYPPELKWKAVNMKLANHNTSDIMKTLGIKYKTQLKVWMRWYRQGKTHRFHQPVGKQYTYNKGVNDMSICIKSLTKNMNLVVGCTNNCHPRIFQSQNL